ncbi:hypothetical protein AB0368_37070 [Actinoplanes sp. NPDC051475]|uniref:hypothetical protein n=1 Tax=Actinoplanes sp. NPDC051475 TaxID=3157225 RepID=UPI00344EF1D1
MKASNGAGSRRLLSLLGTAVAASVAATVGLTSPATASPVVTVSSGADLTGWQTVLGGSTFAATGQAAVTGADVAVENRSDYSSLRSNVARRGVMADALSYKRVSGDKMMNTIHRAVYSFQLPSVPSMAGGALNAQTVEGGLFVWDGAVTRLDNGIAFQWVLNPWLPNFGQLRVWSDANGGAWIPAGYLKPDTAWHSVRFAVDPLHQASELTIDGTSLAAPYTKSPKASWGTDVSARLQVEAISLWPGSAATSAPTHEVLVKDWSWTQEVQQTEAEKAAELAAAEKAAADQAAAEKAAADQAAAEKAAADQAAAEQAAAEQAAAEKVAAEEKAAAEQAAAEQAAADQAAAAEQAAAEQAAAEQAAAEQAAAADKAAADKAAADKAAAEKATKAQQKAAKAVEKAAKAAEKAKKAQEKADKAAEKAKKAQDRADKAAEKLKKAKERAAAVAARIAAWAAARAAAKHNK